jgi:hypothetical protein
MTEIQSFYIYITGSANDTSDTGNHTMANYYPGLILDILLPADGLLVNICKCIPPIFTQIIIIHHDIIIDKSIDKYKKNISTRLNDILNISFEKQQIDPRVIHHSFTIEPLNIDEIHSEHLIIDMAHLYTYNTDHCIKYSCHYSESVRTLPPIQHIKSIYVGWMRRDIKSKQLIKFNEQTNRLITFIDCLIDSGINDGYMIYDPIDLLDKTINKIKKIMMDIWRDKKGKVLAPFAGGNFDKIFADYNIIDELLYKLFNKEKIYDINTYSFYTDYMQKVIDPSIN